VRPTTQNVHYNNNETYGGLIQTFIHRKDNRQKMTDIHKQKEKVGDNFKYKV